MQTDRLCKLSPPKTVPLGEQFVHHAASGQQQLPTDAIVQVSVERDA
jgi:hypothetical protein